MAVRLLSWTSLLRKAIFTGHYETDKEVKLRDGVQGPTESNLLEGAAKGEILDHCTQGTEVWGLRRTDIGTESVIKTLGRMRGQAETGGEHRA